MAKTFVITDIHGCFDELIALYKQIPINPEKDKMVFLGDYIDRGPKSKQVVDQLMEWSRKYPHWVFLYGNHEDLMLDALDYGGRIYHNFDLWYDQGGKETHESYIPLGLNRYERSITQARDMVLPEHRQWLMALPRWYEDGNYFYVHGGIKPGMHPRDMTSNDLIWIRDEFIDSKHDWGKKVIFGHTPDDKGHYYNPSNPWGRMQRFMPIVKKNKIGIDTAVCPGANHKLTCLELPTEKFYFQDSFYKENFIFRSVSLKEG